LNCLQRSYFDLRVRAAADIGELAGDLADTGLLGAFEADGIAHFYWPSESWNPAILESFRALLEERGIMIDATDLSLEVVPDRDWNVLWAQSVRPIRIGRRLLIRQSWNPVDAQPGVIELVIDPKRAFGTGFHATTQLLLEWLEDAVRTGDRVLDVGTGSGVLAMAAVRLGACSALGIDCDPEAIECAQENASANGFGTELEFRLESVERLEAAGFDTVIANIDRNTLLRFPRELARTVGRQGRLCLSGIQAQDLEDILSAFAEHGGRSSGQWQRDEWFAMEIRFASPL
jgi:ribosomal protein L11 methyltransferase